VKVVVLECCEKTVCLVPKVTDTINSGQTQRKYKVERLKGNSGQSKKNAISKLRKRCHVY